MVVACWLLCVSCFAVARCVLFRACSVLLGVGWWWLCVVRCLLSVVLCRFMLVCGVSFVVGCVLLLHGVCCSLIDGCCLSFGAVRCVLFVVCCL